MVLGWQEDIQSNSQLKENNQKDSKQSGIIHQSLNAVTSQKYSSNSMSSEVSSQDKLMVASGETIVSVANNSHLVQSEPNLVQTHTDSMVNVTADSNDTNKVKRLASFDNSMEQPAKVARLQSTINSNQNETKGSTLSDLSNNVASEIVQLADVAASQTYTEQVVSQSSGFVSNVVDSDVVNLTGVGPESQVQIVVEQDDQGEAVNKNDDFQSNYLTQQQGPQPPPAPVQEEVVQTNTATVAAPHGVNPAMMSNLLHTAAAVALSQNAAAATVQVIPGHSAGTIQLVQLDDIQKTQELMAAGMPSQAASQPGEDKSNQQVFTYLVTSQGTLIAAHASDGSELISGANTPGNQKKAKKRAAPKNQKGSVLKAGEDRKLLHVWKFILRKLYYLHTVYIICNIFLNMQ